MPETKITGGDNLVESRIIPRIETYYLVTKDNLTSLSGKSVLTDVFCFIASLSWGAYFSVLIAIRASSKLAEETIRSLSVYQTVFFVVAVILSLLAVLFLVIRQTAVGTIRKTTLPEEWPEERWKTSSDHAPTADPKKDACR